MLHGRAMLLLQTPTHRTLKLPYTQRNSQLTLSTTPLGLPGTPGTRCLCTPLGPPKDPLGTLHVMSMRELQENLTYYGHPTYMKRVYCG